MISMFRLVWTAALLLIIVAPNAKAQQSALDDSLRYFPPGVYEGFLHLDRTFRPEDELSRTLERLISDELEDSLLTRIPLFNNYDSATLALADSVDLDSPSAQGKKRRKETTGFLFFWREMLVLRGPNCAEVIANAEKQGRLERMPGRKNSPVIFKFSGRSQDSEIYVHVTDSSEVLLCENRRVLLAMINAGKGTRLGVLDDPDVAEMLAYVPSAPIWFIAPTVHKHRAELADLVERGAPESKVEEQREQLEKEQQFFVALVDAEDDVVYRELFVFADTETAEAAMEDEDALEGLGSPFPEEAMLEESREQNGRTIEILKRYSLDKLREIQAAKRQLEIRQKEALDRNK